MPISAAKRRAYPGGSLRSPEWKSIRTAILARAEGRCEGTTQFPECRAVNAQPHPDTGSRVVLTIAHMDHDTSHNEETNLRALCQRCHLAWDHRIHVANAGATRRQKAGKADLPDLSQPSLWEQIGEELPVLTGPVQPEPIVEVQAPMPAKPAPAEKHVLAPGMRRPRAGEGWWVRHCVQKTSPAGSTSVLREVVGVNRPRESVVIADILLWDGLIARVEITGFPALEGLDFLWDDGGVPGTRLHWDEAAHVWTRIPHR